MLGVVDPTARLGRQRDFIDGRRPNHLRFADDMVLITHTIDEAQRMLEELQRESAKVGLRGPPKNKL